MAARSARSRAAGKFRLVAEIKPRRWRPRRDFNDGWKRCTRADRNFHAEGEPTAVLSTLHDSSLDPVILLTTRLLAFVNTWWVVEVRLASMFGILELFDRVLFLFWRRVRDFVREDCVYFVMILLDVQCFFSFFWRIWNWESMILIRYYSKTVKIIFESFDKLLPFFPFPFHNSVCVIENEINAMEIVLSLFFQTYKLVVI